MTLLAQTLTGPAVFEELAPEWTALDALATPRTPFTSVNWNRLWWKHFRRARKRVRDHLRIVTVRDTAGALVAVAPMMLTQRPGYGPIRARELQFFGADSNITEVRGILVDPARREEALQVLSEHLRVGGGWDWVQWRGLPAASPGTLFRILPGFNASRELVFHQLPLEASWDALRTRLPRNLKESLRKCYNSLARDGHAWELDVIAEPDALGPALQRLLQLHAMRAEAEGTVAHLNAFSQTRAQAFIAEFVQAEGAADRVRLFAIRIGAVHVAMRLGFVCGDELYLYYSGFDPAWGRYSVMTTVVAEAIKWAIENGVRRVNLSTGTDVSKTRWRPEQITFLEGYQAADRLSSRLGFSMLDFLRRRRLPHTTPEAQAPAREE